MSTPTLVPTTSQFLPGPGVPDLVSIVIPTYQRGAIIADTLDSMLAQTYENYEAIIVDDGSTDNTREIVARYSDPRITYIRKENGGLSSARNVGFQHVRGEFVAFLDSDDLWLPWKLKMQMELFRRHPDVGMIWSDMSTFVNPGEIIDDRHLRTYYSAYDRFEVMEICRRVGVLGDLSSEVPPELADCGYFVGNIFREMFFGNLVHPPTAIVRRSRLQQSGGFQPEVTGRGAEDYHFYFRICEAGPVAYLDAPTIHYRIHATQMSTTNTLLEAHADLRMVQHWTPRIAPMLSPRLLRQRTAESHAWVGAEELSVENVAVARPHLWKSLQLRLSLRTSLHLLASLFPVLLPAVRAIKRRANALRVRVTTAP